MDCVHNPFFYIPKYTEDKEGNTNHKVLVKRLSEQ